MNRQSNNRSRNIIFLGMPGAGKTTLGRVYAFKTGRIFIDFDKYLEHHSGKSIPEIIATEGNDGLNIRIEKCFRRLERKHTTVLSCSGAVLCNIKALRFARTFGLLVLLKAPIDILATRIFGTVNKRMLFNACDSLPKLQTSLQQLFDARQPFYDCADILLETAFSSIDCLSLQLFAIEKQAHYIMQRRVIPKILLDTTDVESSLIISPLAESWNDIEAEPPIIPQHSITATTQSTLKTANTAHQPQGSKPPPPRAHKPYNKDAPRKT